MPFHSSEQVQFQCRHILTDGRRCKNPTLRAPRTDENPAGHENFCYFHHTTRRPIQNPRARHCRRSTFTLPLLEDRSAIQLAIGQILQQIASNQIDPRRAGLLLYGLQIASLNLPKPNPKRESEPATVSEITHDPIHGHLAPPAALGHDEPKSSIHRLLEHFDRIDTIQAVAAPSRTKPNSPPLKNLPKTPPEGPPPDQPNFPPSAPAPRHLPITFQNRNALTRTHPPIMAPSSGHPKIQLTRGSHAQVHG